MLRLTSGASAWGRKARATRRAEVGVMVVILFWQVREAAHSTVASNVVDSCETDWENAILQHTNRRIRRRGAQCWVVPLLQKVRHAVTRSLPPTARQYGLVGRIPRGLADGYRPAFAEATPRRLRCGAAHPFRLAGRNRCPGVREG